MFSPITSAIRRLIRRRQSALPTPPATVETTELGTSASVAPRTTEYARLWIERYDRRSVILDIHKLLADNPLISQAAQVFVDSAVSKGFTVTVDRTATRGARAANELKAQRVIDRLIRDAGIRKKLPSWGRMLLTEGDLFIQNVEFHGQIINAKRMPAVTMERNSDERDAFPDVLAAYRQLDVSTNEELAKFALWQIVHARWNYVDGERYGSSQYLQLRTLSRVFLDMVLQMAIRRRTRGPLRLFHRVGTEQNPGDEADVMNYKKWNGFADLERRGELDTLTDFFGNGLTKVEAIEGDARLGDIADVEFILNVLFPRTAVTKGLIGFGENVSRDILDEQREFLFLEQDLLIDVLEWEVLRPVFDLALMVEGINPDSILYAIQFEDRMTEAGKLARMEVLLEVYEAGLMTIEQFVERSSVYLNIKDVSAYIEQIHQSRAKGLSPPQRRRPGSSSDPSADRNNRGDEPYSQRSSILSVPASAGRENVSRLMHRNRI